MKVHKYKIQDTIWESILRILSSILFGCLFYVAWLATFLQMGNEGKYIETLLWIAAPLVTGIGFTSGIVLFDHLIEIEGEALIQVLIWPVIGCFIGALLVYWFGPMLIVFSMLSLGTLSVSIREVIRRRDRI